MIFLGGGWHSPRNYDIMMIARQIRKLLERFLNPKEANRIHKRKYWLCRLAVKTLAGANITESDSALILKYFGNL